MWGIRINPALKVPTTLPRVEYMKIVPADKPMCRSEDNRLVSLITYGEMEPSKHPGKAKSNTLANIDPSIISVSTKELPKANWSSGINNIDTDDAANRCESVK